MLVYVQVAKDAKECLQECVSEFISFITSEYPFQVFCCRLEAVLFSRSKH